MTSKICGSGQFFQWQIFKVVRIDRLKRNTLTYVFVGEHDREVKNILYDLENGKKISAKDEKKLKEIFKNQYNYLLKHKTSKFKYIYQGIYTDDTISTIRKKIFAFLSTSGDLLIEQNQELWVKMCDKRLKILGPTWTNIVAEPSFLQKTIEPDYKKFVSKNGQMILIEQIININDQTLFDATNGLKFEGNEIFLHMMEDEMRYLRDKGKKVDKLILDGYFQKYWPHGLIDYDDDMIYKDMERLRKSLKAEDKLINFVEKIPVDDVLFDGCKIIQVLVHITNPYEHEFVDLLKIFNLFNLDEKTPFMRYKDYEWPAPYYLFYKPLVDNKTISEKQMKEWVSATKKVKDATDQVIKEVQYSVRGLTLKRYIYTLDGEPKYATINIHKNGNMEVRIAFKEKQRATMRDVYNALQDIGKLINKINEIDYRFRQMKIRQSVKLLPPDVTYNNTKNLIEFHGRTRLILMDAINGVSIPENFNYRDMNNFANKYFTPYLSPVLSKKDYEKTEMLVKFKRVSFYSRMNVEYEFIHKTILQNPNILPKNVVQLLHENYYAGKPIEDAIKVYKDWERKYGYMGSQGVKGARQTGVEIKIKHGKVHLNGSKNIMQLTNASVFLTKFLNIYFNQAKYLKKSDVKNIFSNELAKLENVENNVNMNVIANSINITNEELLNYDYGNVLGNIYGDEYAALNENDNREEEVLENSENFNRIKYLAANDEIDRNIRMQCEDKDTKRDVCVDFCEDEFYTLRRLQKYDNAVFRFRSDPKFDNYARQCQPQERQPLVMRFNPEENPKVDKEAYKNAVKYGSAPDRQNWFICAQVWCPYEEIPIKYSLIKDSIIDRPTRKGKCLTAKCPSCLKEKRTTWLRIVEDKKFHPYVGFIDDSNHPNHLCMPCCYKKPMDNPKSKGYSKYMKCLGKNVDNVGNKEGVDYIMGRDKMPLTRNRYGLLPINLAKLFLSKCETGKMQTNTTCFLRYGVKDDTKQSFLQAIAGIVSEKTHMNLTTLKKYLFETVLNRRLFNSLNQGELAVIFDNGKDDPLDNFKKFMMSDDQKINEQFLWDFLQRPNVLEKAGVNIYIFTSKSIMCPKGFNSKEFYDPSKKSVLLYTDGRYYEPIFEVTNKKGIMQQPQKIFNDDKAVMQKIYNIATTNCISKNLISWDKIRKKSLGHKYFDLKPQITAKELMKKMTDISGQIKDSYNKTYALISRDGFLLPIKPQGEIVELPIIEKWKAKKVKQSIKYYNDLSKKDIPYLPMRVYKEQTGEIIALKLEDGSIIPTQNEKVGTDLIEAPDKYYYDVDSYIATGSEDMDERAKMTMYLIYIQESYDRLRLELARKLQTISERDKIVNVIEDKKMPKKLQREYIKGIVEKVCKKIVVILPELPFPIEKYVKPSLRRTCGVGSKSKDLCITNPHCYYSGGECKLIVLQKSPIDGMKLFEFFVDRVSDELLRNRLLRDEILEDKLDEVIDKTVEIRNDEIVIYGARDLIAQVQELYKPKKDFILRDEDMFSTTEPNYKGVNKEKYMASSKELTLDTLNLQQLPSYWKGHFGQKVKYYDDKILNDTLYYAILRVLVIIAPEVRNINMLKNLQIDKISNLTKQDIDRDELFKTMYPDIIDGINRIIAIYRSVNGGMYKSINTLTQLKEFIMSDEYPANQVDVFLLSQALGINIIILEKRIKKNNQKGFFGYVSNLKKDFIVLLEHSRLGKTVYSIVGKNNNYVFKKKDLPKNIKDYYGFKNDEENSIKYEIPHKNKKNDENKVKKKMRKIKMAKKKYKKNE